MWRTALPAGRLLARLAVVAAALLYARRRALGGFRRGLREMGLPREAIEELAREYPSLDLKGVIRHGR